MDKYTGKQNLSTVHNNKTKRKPFPIPDSKKEQSFFAGGTQGLTGTVVPNSKVLPFSIDVLSRLTMTYQQPPPTHSITPQQTLNIS